MTQEIIFGVIGGLGLFIYGIKLMGEGLQKAAGDKMRKLLKALTSNPLMGTLVGAGVTSMVQSSSATTVMAVGFVNAGLMTLKQSIGVILGANIGTTITAQIIAFKLTDFALPILGVGFAIHFFSKRRFWKFFGLFMLGFGMLFLGLNIMGGVVKPLGESEAVRQAFLNFSNNPFLAVLTGVVVTFIVQSSSVSIGLVLTLASVGLLDLQAAIPLMLGANIGTCITAMLASIGATITARRTAVAHVIFNTLGSVIVLLILPLYKEFILGTSSDLLRQCANAHTIFNIMNTIIFLPFVGLYAKLVTKIVPGEEIVVETGPKFLESHLLNTPLVALDAATKEIIRMAKLAKEMVNDAMKCFFKRDLAGMRVVSSKENVLDSLQGAVAHYLVELTQRSLSEEESSKIPPMLHSVNDLERIGDHSENLSELAERVVSERLPFSEQAKGELEQMRSEIEQMAVDVIKALETNNPDDAKLVIHREDRINKFTDQLKQNHIKRLNDGTCKVLSGIVFLDMINNFEKIGDHLTNVGQAVMGDLQWRH